MVYDLCLVKVGMEGNMVDWGIKTMLRCCHFFFSYMLLVSSSIIFNWVAIVVWCSLGFYLLQFKPEEVAAIMKDFDEPGSLAPTGLHLGGVKYMVIQGEPGVVIRGKKVIFVSLCYHFLNFVLLFLLCPDLMNMDQRSW